jgi:two-component system sensor histidine kinase KdpD
MLGAHTESRDTIAATERITLTVGTHRLGVLELHGTRPPLGPGEGRVLRAFSDQLALALERDRLLRVAAKAETYRSTEKLRRALLTAVSHDLRSPLSAIKASVTDLLDTDAPVEAGYRYEVLETIDQEVDRLNALIANLLDMSRIEAGMLRANLQAVDAQDAINHCVDRAKRRWPDLHIGATIEEGAAIVRADEVFLERVITNLIDNAGRASTEAGCDTIDVGLRAHADRATAIRVIDHGKGVTENVREHLFHPFYDLDERSSRLGPGIGLAICKGFVDAMQGQIWIEETPGGGATFAVSLPTEDGR